MKRSLWTVALLAVAVGVAAVVRAEPEPASSVGASAPIGLAAPGRVEPRGEEIEVGARRPGLLVTMHVDENDTVVAGQILAEIDRRELEAERAAAVAAIELEQAERERLVHGARGQERQAARARLRAADAALALARKEHARAVPLHERGVLTTAETDRTREQLDSASAQQTEAAKQLALLEAGARADEVAIADARIALAQARLAAIDAQIESTYVRAPSDGVVLRRLRRPGEIVAAQPPTPLLVIGDLSHKMVRAEIDEIDVARVQTGDRVEVISDAYPEQRFGGSVVRIAQRVGAKRVYTDRPSELQDRKVLDALIELEPGNPMPVGLRVDVLRAP
ncbi:MAG: efflux RND transporter periplasmic adaptor subunit [Nannocystaceae bacterium]|nr:efflux RND transporter periplasmic adaptor subunit [Nannocystaceae bacterium]